jgi:hypothetical protein
VSAIPAEFEELRINIERLRTLLENLVVRGLRACGPEELSQLRAHGEHLEQAGAGHLSSVLSALREQIEQDKPSSATKLLEAQTNVRLLERLLTLRVVQGQYAMAIAMLDHPGEAGDDADGDEDEDEE